MGQLPHQPEDYTRLLKIGATRAREADPNAVIIAGALASTIELAPDAPPPGNALNDLIFLQRMYDAGAAPYFDIMAMQAYGLWSGPTDRRMHPRVMNFGRPQFIRDLMVENGDATQADLDQRDGLEHRAGGRAGQTFRPGDARAAGAVHGLAYDRAQAEWPWVGVVNTWYFKRATDEWLKAKRPEAYFRLADPDFTLQPVYESVKEHLSAASRCLVPGMHEPEGWGITQEGAWQTVEAPASPYGTTRMGQAGAALQFAFTGTALGVETAARVATSCEGSLLVSVDDRAPVTVTVGSELDVGGGRAGEHGPHGDSGGDRRRGGRRRPDRPQRMAVLAALDCAGRAGRGDPVRVPQAGRAGHPSVPQAESPPTAAATFGRAAGLSAAAALERRHRVAVMRQRDRDTGLLILLLLLILVIAAGLRFYQLGAQSLWSDEGNSAALADAIAGTHLPGRGQRHPSPAVLLAAAPLDGLFGRIGGGLRSLSAVLGVLLVLAIAELGPAHPQQRDRAPGRPDCGDRAVPGLLQPGSAHVHPAGARSGHRHAAVLVAAEPGGQPAALRHRRRHGRAERPRSARVRWLPFSGQLLVLAWTAGLYTHYAFPLIIALSTGLYALWLIATRRRGRVGSRILRWLLFLAITVGLYAPWAGTAVRQLTAWPAPGAARRSRRANPHAAHDRGVWHRSPRTGCCRGPARSFLLGLLGALPWPYLSRDHQAGGPRMDWLRCVLPLAWLLAPVVMIVVLGLFRGAYLKFLLIGSPAFALLLARGVAGPAAWLLVGQGVLRPGKGEETSPLPLRMHNAGLAGLRAV